MKEEQVDPIPFIAENGDPTHGSTFLQLTVVALQEDRKPMKSQDSIVLRPNRTILPSIVKDQ
jgi:hypothetical protein